MAKKIISFKYVILSLLISANIYSQTSNNTSQTEPKSISNNTSETFTNKEGSKYQFTVIKDLDKTPTQSQDKTGTCWSFSTLSFLESELLRKGKGTYNLSEMFIARSAYIGKAQNYFRYYGTFSFGPGGAFHDIPWVVKNVGLMPEEAYYGKKQDEKHNHDELHDVLESTVKTFVKKKNGTLTQNWQVVMNSIIDSYIGEMPKNNKGEIEFTYQGKKYTPRTFADMLSFDFNDYVSLTSFTHHEFYKPFILEVQDNWSLQQSYNLPIDEFMRVMEESVMNGYSFAWGSDVSEDGFGSKHSLCVLPSADSTLKAKKIEGNDKYIQAFYEPVTQKIVSQEERQQAFDNQETTDDHGMHIVGLVKDQNGNKYFKVKNSWGTKYNSCDGFIYSSIEYTRYKTINILIHKDAIPKDLRKKLNL